MSPYSVLKVIQKQTEKNPILISSPANINYIFNGLVNAQNEQSAFLLITASNLYVITSHIYEEEYKKMLKNKAIVRLVSAKNTLGKIINDICKKYKYKNLIIESNHILLSQYIKLEKNINSLALKPSSCVFEKFRIIKNKEEILNIKKAAKKTDKLFSHITAFISKNKKITEQKIAKHIQRFVCSTQTTMAFPTITACDENSTFPHYAGLNTKQCKSIILIDAGAVHNNYCADETRTYLLNPSAKIQNLYQKLLFIQEKIINYLKPGITVESVHKLTKTLFRKYNMDKYCKHSIGHGIGLKIHEPPFISQKNKTILMPGTTLTIEPGIYIPSIGGMRIEDTLLITKKGVQTLTNTPKSLNAVTIAV